MWWSDADRAMTRLERSPSLADTLAAVRRTLGRLELDPFDPRLRTRQFVTEGYGQIRSTPAGHGDWTVFWKSGPGSNQITIAFIGEARV